MCMHVHMYIVHVCAKLLLDTLVVCVWGGGGGGGPGVKQDYSDVVSWVSPELWYIIFVFSVSPLLSVSV